jgi:hypothetical protein
MGKIAVKTPFNRHGESSVADLRIGNPLFYAGKRGGARLGHSNFT